MNENTSLPFKVIVPIMLALISSVWFVSAKLNNIETKLDKQWTREQQSRWADQLRTDNAGIKVPSIYEIRN